MRFTTRTTARKTAANAIIWVSILLVSSQMLTFSAKKEEKYQAAPDSEKGEQLRLPPV